VLQDHVIRSCRRFLRPIIHFLIRQGVLWSTFSELAKEVFVDVARAEYGIDGRPTNNSRVAMLTGLSRREAARVRDVLLEERPNDVERQGNRMAKILTGWHTDPEFIDAGGKPLQLSATGFTDLLNRFAGDLPHTAVKKEMLAHGLIATQSDGTLRVLHRDYIYSTLDPEIIRQMGVALHDHAATLDHNLNPDRGAATRFERLADNARIPAHKVDAFHAFIEERGLEFLQDVDAWLSKHELDEQDASVERTVRLGAGAYLIHDEF
jgi:hypothetical protein